MSVCRHDVRHIAGRTQRDKWGCQKSENLCTSKVTAARVEDQLIEWKKMFTNHTFDEGLLSIIYIIYIYYII